MNDKIVMKVWHKNFGSEEFIANIPENPFLDSWFNINYLQSTGGNIQSTWINMYGIPPDERQGFFSKILKGKNHHIEGTEYMGSCLLSMNLIPHESPEFIKEHLNGNSEPKMVNYILRVDILEL